MMELIFGLVVLGLILYFVDQLPLDPIIHTLIRVVVIVCVIYWLAGFLGFANLPVPRFRH